MAIVFKKVNGRKITKVIALTSEAQNAIDDKALFAAQNAEGYLLAARVRTGTSYISVEKGDVDSYVVLDDTRGLDAALSIEFGRRGYEDPETGEEKGASAGLFVLNRAFPALSGSKKRPRRGGDSLRE